MQTNPIFLIWLEQRLRQSTTIIAEYTLLKELKAHGLMLDYSDPQKLFNSHFILFHHLYTLQTDLAAQTGETLIIEATGIQLVSRQADIKHSVSSDIGALRDFYLDTANLHTDAATLNKWLDDFWQAFTIQDEISQAFSILSLPAGSDIKDITRRYRQLSMRHHPDRGGNSDDFQQIQKAMKVLRKFKQTSHIS